MGWKENEDSCVLYTSLRHCTSLEYVGFQYFCWRKITIACLHAWKDTIETTSRILDFISFILLLMKEQKIIQKDSRERLILNADFQYCTNIAKTHVMTTKVIETTNNHLLLLLSSNQVDTSSCFTHEIIQTHQTNASPSMELATGNIQEAGWKNSTVFY